MKSVFSLAAVLFTSTVIACEAEYESAPFPEHLLESSPKVSCLTECCQTLKSRPAQYYTYYQDTGHFIGGTGEWAINTHGYSGQNDGYMNPAKQCVVNTGPLPAARYKLGYCQNTMHTPAVTRPCSFYLDPQEPSKMCGRGSFFIHGCQCCTAGDTSNPPVRGCSAGCVVIS